MSVAPEGKRCAPERCVRSLDIQKRFGCTAEASRNESSTLDDVTTSNNRRCAETYGRRGQHPPGSSRSRAVASFLARGGRWGLLAQADDLRRAMLGVRSVQLTRRGSRTRCSSATATTTCSVFRHKDTTDNSNHPRLLLMLGSPLLLRHGPSSGAATTARRATEFTSAPSACEYPCQESRLKVSYQSKNADLSIDDDVSHGRDGGCDAGQERDDGAKVVQILPDRGHRLYLRTCQTRRH